MQPGGWSATRNLCSSAAILLKLVKGGAMALTTRALTDDGPDLGTFLLAAFCVFLSALASTLGTLLQKVAQGRRAAAQEDAEKDPD